MNKDIFEELYRRYYTSAVRYVMSLCKDPELAGDIVADAFVKAFTTLDDHQPSFRYWLFRVCKNLWIDHLRKNKNIVTDEQTEAVNYITPETLRLESDRIKALWNAVNSLSDIDREIVVLYYFSSLPLKEVALSVNKSYVAVRQRLTRLRAILKQKMEEQGYDF